jgi:hypothetical protein
MANRPTPANDRLIDFTRKTRTAVAEAQCEYGGKGIIIGWETSADEGSRRGRRPKAHSW